jgi:hypothetical protein
MKNVKIPRMNINPRRRRDYSAMVPERNRAIARLSKRVDISVAGLRKVEENYLRCRKRWSRFALSDADWATCTTGKEAVELKRRLKLLVERDLFYATVERDAYKIVLYDREPSARPANAKPHDPRTKTLTEAQKRRVYTLRYRMNGHVRELQAAEHDLAMRRAERDESRRLVESAAAKTHLLIHNQETLTSQARMAGKATARAPNGSYAAIRDSQQEWRVAYTAWSRLDREVKALREVVRRKREVIAGLQERMEGTYEEPPGQ